ncbi:DeoR/GlpR family DNA-binding transcription regulator [Microterricola pindariensis]|uniref:DeoR family transcriptional regulator n=1 Tax=Microterricola pindariensis TaxID=478010 RepID=A0ABX5AU66_9MICO|nr:DeoR/GlpR family DNA-binding transcription regulator [Microterricola pindariensis]PPL15720.1 DeoR family transcriptional regulator [Microterricola pindariensis]
MTNDARDALPAWQRREQIAAMLLERGFVRVAELAESFGVSGVTARTDLDALVETGLAERVHGGAVPVGQAQRERAFEVALAESVQPKQQIGALAASLVQSGQSVLLDVGTTTLAVARALKARRDLSELVIVTNGLSIALELESEIPRFTVIVTGGALRPLQHSLVDPLADLVLSQVHADIAFIGCNGVDAVHGVSNINLPEAAVKARMVASAARAVIVADSSKLGRVHLGTVAPLAAFDTLVTDAAAPAALGDGLSAALEHAGVRILLPSDS